MLRYPSRPRKADHNQRSPWRCQVGQPPKRRGQIGEVMQRRHRGDDIKGPAERMVHHVVPNPFDARRLAPRAVQHSLVDVDGDHLGNPFTQFGCEQSVAGPDV